MKLYAKVSSERATKGQGGNEYLTIDITAGHEAQKLIARIKVHKSPYETTKGYENFVVQWVELTRQGTETGIVLHGESIGVQKDKAKRRKGDDITPRISSFFVIQKRIT